MRRIPIIVFAVLLIMVGGATGVGYAWDASRGDLVADGVRAGGVEIGGMRANRARQVLEAELAAPLERPLKVRVGEREFSLTARRARVRTDVDRMVAIALRRSRAGDPLTRTMRDARGERVNADVPLEVSYSRRAVKRLVRKVKKTMDREPKNARVVFRADDLAQVRGRMGRSVRGGSLERRIRAEIVRPEADRLVRTRVLAVRPEVTAADLARRYPTVLTVDRSNFKLHFWRNLQRERTYRIAVGQVGLETPAGLYHVQNKAIDPDWLVPDSDWAGDMAGEIVPGGTPENPLKARWMGIYDGAGIHGTDDEDSLGSSASHGCIRMAVPEVKELYERVELQTPVFIA